MNFLIHATLEDASGYGQHVAHTARQLDRLGHRVRFQPLHDSPALPAFFQDRLARPGDSGQVIQISPPFSPCPPGAIYCTTWESDSLPEVCAAHLSNARVVIVNSRFIGDAFRSSGVRPLVEVVPLGICPEEYHPLPEFARECRFGVVANLAYSPRRKNLQGAVDAFRLAFAGAEDASLTLKINETDHFDHPGDSNLTIVRERFSTERLRWFYNSLTCLVSASMAEEFGLCPLQAMACGRPVIATTYAGHAEYLDDSVGYPVAYDLIRPDWYEGGGRLARPSVRSLADAMRAVYDDRATARAKGTRSRKRAHDFTWDHHGDRLIAIIQQATGSK